MKGYSIENLKFKRIENRKYCPEDYEVWEKGNNKVYISILDRKDPYNSMRISSLLPLTIDEWYAVYLRIHEIVNEDNEKNLIV